MIKPRKPKKPHPAEIAAELQMVDAIRAADYFVASLFVGRGEYAIKTAQTVVSAIGEAHKLEADSRAFTRRATISAVLEDGRAVLITDKIINELKAAGFSAGFKLA